MENKPVSKVAELRKQANLTQRQLADAVGVTESTIANYEKGRNCLAWFERVAKLCETLGCTPRDLIGSEVVSDEND
jgi:putative transcriptional regulator